MKALAIRQLKPGPEDSRYCSFYSSFVPRQGLVFDVGANQGDRVRVFAALGARVIAMEPQRGCAEVLRYAWRGHSKVTIIAKAVGSEPGKAVMHISTASHLSSMAQDWIEATRASGRFTENYWQFTEVVSVVTLDQLIEEYGLPDFMKIDVEGYELEALKGLSAAPPALSFEFTPECLEKGLRCVARLESLGDSEFQFSTEETLRWHFPNWLDRRHFLERLPSLPAAHHGDIYARRLSPVKAPTPAHELTVPGV